jgi:uncharacterized membrane protein
LLFGFAIVVMPGIAQLDDKAYLLAFKHMDEIIQNNHPLFVLVWAGSVLAVMATLMLGVMDFTGTQRSLLLFASGLYLVGVQGPTFRFNIPLNNALQRLEIASLDETESANARAEFEVPWNRWNHFRTFNAVVSVSAFLLLLLQ